MTAIDLSGQTFGRLTAIERVGNHKRSALWKCSCACGRVCNVISHNLRRGGTKSCGCLKRERRLASITKHGHTKHTPRGVVVSRTYRSWKSMLQRCTNPNSRRFEDWGGRGITVCERWLRFEHFLADMGERPDGASLDRIDNDGNYEPGNCRWASAKEQASNRRRRKGQ